MILSRLTTCQIALEIRAAEPHWKLVLAFISLVQRNDCLFFGLSYVFRIYGRSMYILFYPEIPLTQSFHYYSARDRCTRDRAKYYVPTQSVVTQILRQTTGRIYFIRMCTSRCKGESKVDITLTQDADSHFSTSSRFVQQLPLNCARGDTHGHNDMGKSQWKSRNYDDGTSTADAIMKCLGFRSAQAVQMKTIWNQ